MKSYEELLKNAKKNLPDKMQGGERFEPPRARVQLQGSKAIIQNFDIICQKLRRDPKFLAKYLGKELAVPSAIDGPRLILHGKIYERQINERLSNFIKAYVICNECSRPDTKIVESGSGVKMLVCEACGARAPAK
ncbi:translation initiation factor IF-2 subunit beta [Candidatus Micrarchaeota archaeon CG10_big_fil_rev_8_21_14_0_10_45_29]|nr:MAG: translation initiation factor IF-2 subunit beta [Candidatus Micrarchaeota archaeon CG10_big_fil_rev_8_21_14_0_10_45_29]